MRKPLVVGNWKMNGNRQSVAVLLKALLQGYDTSLAKVETVVCPPFVFLEQTMTTLAHSDIRWGAQNISDQIEGAFTGEISAAMLSDYQCEYVIVGHSERRSLFHEDNNWVGKKFVAALKAKLKPILCLGESAEQRQNGETLSIIEQQLAAVLDLVDNHGALREVVIAYEPVWAIGTGVHASPQQAQEVHQAIRVRLANLNSELAKQVRILYGGSVKADNANSLFSMPDIDGALVGGASLQANQFLEIIKQCNN